MLLSSAKRTKRCPRRSNSRSSESSTRLLSKGERGPPCGVPSTLGLTNPFSINPGVQERPDELQQPFVFDTLGDLCHQFVMINSIEKFLQIEINHPAVAFGNVPLCLRYSLMRRSSRSKTVAVIGKCWVPLPLQNLHHRLLNEAVQHGREAKLSHPSVWLRYLYPFHRLWFISPT